MLKYTTVMKAILGWVKVRLALVVTYMVLVSVMLAVFVYKQNSIIPGANTYERTVIQAVDNYEYTWRAPLNSPYVTASYVAKQLTFLDSLQASRLIAAIASVASIYMFFQLLRNWLLSPGKALVGTALFATSSWTLVLGRGAHSSMVGVFLLLLIFTLGTRLLFTTKPFYDWLFLVIATCLSLYTPMLPWLVLIAGGVSLLHYRRRQSSLPIKKWQKIVVGATAVLLLLPLVLAIARSPRFALDLLAVSNPVRSIPDLFINFIEIIKTIFFVADHVSPLGLGNLPFVDIFSLFMFIIGFYYFERRLALKRSKMLFGGLAMGILICSISKVDMLNVSILLPLVYIFVSAGLHETITRWLNVFPRNPLARSTGIIAIAIALGFTSSYHLTKVFIARPGNPEIRELYSAK
jgi:hypothetical protein